MIHFAWMALAAQAAFDDGRLLPLASGDWTYSADAKGSAARFGNLFLIRCDRGTRRVTLNRLTAPARDGGTMSIITDTQTASYPGAVTSLSASDPMLDAIAFTRGRFVVDVKGVGKTALPFEPEVARSIEDCRN